MFEEELFVIVAQQVSFDSLNNIIVYLVASALRG